MYTISICGPDLTQQDTSYDIEPNLSDVAKCARVFYKANGNPRYISWAIYYGNTAVRGGTITNMTRFTK